MNAYGREQGAASLFFILEKAVDDKSHFNEPVKYIGDRPIII